MRPRTAKARRGSGSPSTETSPACGRSSVARIRSSVDFPAPLWPSTASVAPPGHRERDLGEGRALAEMAVQAAQLNGRAPRPPSRLSVATACRSVGAMTGNSSPIALGLPGKLMISVWPAIPDTPRVSMPVGVYLQRLGPHRLGKARRVALDHRAGRLGGDVIGRQAGAAGGQDQRRTGVDMAPQRRLDRGAVIGDGLLGHNLGAGLRRRGGQRIAGGVLVRPAATEVEIVSTAVCMGRELRGQRSAGQRATDRAGQRARRRVSPSLA